MTTVNIESIKKKASEHIKSGKTCKQVSILLSHGKSRVSDETWTVIVGAVYMFSVQVFIDGEEAEVTQSEWTVNGTIIDLNSAIQNSERSYIPTLNGPVKLSGGAGDTPSAIFAAWASPLGTFPVGITGTCFYNGEYIPFDGNAFVVVQSPSLSYLKSVKFAPGEATIQGEIDIYKNEYKTPILGFDGIFGNNDGLNWTAEANENDMNGIFMFVQLIQQSLASRYSDNNQEQEKGIPPMPDNEYVLDGGINEDGLFLPAYDDEAYVVYLGEAEGQFTIEDGPFEPLLVDDEDFEGLVFNRYIRQDLFYTYVALIPINQQAQIEGFCVGLYLARWGWSGEADYNNNTTWIRSSFNIVQPQITNLDENPVLLQWNGNGQDQQFNEWQNVQN